MGISLSPTVITDQADFPPTCRHYTIHFCSVKGGSCVISSRTATFHHSPFVRACAPFSPFYCLHIRLRRAVCVCACASAAGHFSVGLALSPIHAATQRGPLSTRSQQPVKGPPSRVSRPSQPALFKPTSSWPPISGSPRENAPTRRRWRDSLGWVLDEIIFGLQLLTSPANRWCRGSGAHKWGRYSQPLQGLERRTRRREASKWRYIGCQRRLALLCWMYFSERPPSGAQDWMFQLQTKCMSPTSEQTH